MVFPDNRRERARPEHQGLDEDRFKHAMGFLHANAGGVGADETVVVRNGYLIWKGTATDRVHEIYSATKTFTSTVLGLLVTVDLNSRFAGRYGFFARLKKAVLSNG